MSKRIYIAGPMSGHDDYNFPAFHAAEDELRARGFDPQNPAKNFGGRTDLPYEFYIRGAIDMVSACDAIYLLDGWRGSKGAEMEAAIARCLGLEFYYQTPGNAQSLLDEVRRITNTSDGERNKDYGHPLDNFEQIAALYSAYLGKDVTAEDVAALNICQKLSRLANSPDHRDSWVDVAGYAECVSLLQHERRRRTRAALDSFEDVPQ